MKATGRFQPRATEDAGGRVDEVGVGPTATAWPPASWVLSGTLASTGTMRLAYGLRGKKLIYATNQSINIMDRPSKVGLE